MIPAEIKKLAQTVRQFAQADFRPGIYIYTAILLTVTASFNYYYRFDDDFLEPLKGEWICVWYYFLFYGFAYYAVAIPLLWTSGQQNLLQKPQFWIRSGFFIGMIALAGGLVVPFEWIEALDLKNYTMWTHKVARQIDVLVLGIPIYYLFMRWNEPTLKDGLYGIRLRSEDLKPYVHMLWVMVPLIAAASFLPDFQRQYPIFKRVLPYLPGLETEKWICLSGFEASYVASFVGTELMFRGALVIGMSSLLGRNALLPMVSTYMFLHYGKPMGEAISSVFGGYILGILALQNRNIWGGIFIHSCVAFLMDVAAGLQLRHLLFPL